MYIRMTGGRDRGEVKEFTFADAQDLLRTGQAVPVDVNEPDSLAKKLIEEVKTLPFVALGEKADYPPVPTPPPAPKPPSKTKRKF